MIFILGCYLFTPTVSSQSTRLTQDLESHFFQHQSLKLDAAAVKAQVQTTGHISLVMSDARFDLELTAHDMRGAGYRAEEFGADGVARPVDIGPVRTFKGHARRTEKGNELEVGEARFTIDETRIEGLIITSAERYFVEPARNYSTAASASDYVIYKESEVVASSAGGCGVTLSEQVNQKVAAVGAPLREARAQLATTTAALQELRIATEADNEYVVSKGGAAAADQAILSILNQVAGLYEVELGLTMRVVYQSAWSNPSDPYSSTNPSAMLAELSDFWNANRGSVARDIVHMWTAKNLDNSTIGTAYLEALCRYVRNVRAAYGLSKGVTGAQQIAITAHEIGHNLGATHPNQQVPPVAECNNTVMSSSVGLNPQLTFCQYSRDEIARYLIASANCLGVGTSGLSFAVSSTYNTGINPGDLAKGDFNNDGKDDLIAVSRGDGAIGHATLTVLLGTDNGGFQTANTYPSSHRYIGGIAAGDFDRDGNLDFVFTRSADSDGFNVVVALGSGTGNFTASFVYATGGDETGKIKVYDVDGDSKLDLVVNNDSTISILLGTGAGSFQAAGNYPGRSLGRGVVVGDFNNDGTADLVVSSATSSGLSLLLGTGSGNFQAAGNYLDNEYTHFYGENLVIGDFDGDGIQDLACTLIMARVGLLLGRQTGGFQNAGSFPAGPLPTSVATSIAIGDFNGDSNQDIVVTNSESFNPDETEIPRTVSVLLGTGTGSFQLPVSYFAGFNPVSVKVADFNQDGKPDLIVADGDLGNTVTMLLGTAAATFEYAGSFPGGSIPRDVVLGDYNGDGATDVVVISSSGYSLLLGTGTGSLQAALTAGTCLLTIALGDFTGDGKLDVVAGAGDLVLLIGAGNGTFNEVTRYADAGNVVSLAAGDFNRDGIQDVTVANGNGNTVRVLLGTSSGIFQPPLTYPVGANAQAVAVSDFNRDGKADLAVANNGSNDISVLLGTGTGTFTPSLSYPSGNGPQSLDVADFNNDGNQDIAVANVAGASLSILLGTSTGSFQTALTYSVDVRKVAAGDLNNDGKPDLSTSVGMLLGNGDGSFHPVLSEVFGIPVDFNADGKLDLASLSGGNATVRLGKGDGTFLAPVSYSTGFGPYLVVTGDFNGDDKPDLGAQGLCNFSVLLNTSGQLITAPLNDNFSSAQRIGGPTGTIIGSSLLATKEPSEPNHASGSNGTGGASIWYRWTAPSTGQFYFHTFGSSFATAVAVYTGASLGALSAVAASNSTAPEYVQFNATSGTTYQIAMDGITGDTGKTVLHWTSGSFFNDNFVSPREIRGSSGSVNGDNTNATLEPGEPMLPGTSGARFSVWYRWTAPNSGKVTFSATPCGDTTRLLGAYTGNLVNELSPVGVNYDGYREADDPLICDNRTLRFNAVAGTSYRIQMQSTTGLPFTLNWSYADPPPNDNFANALVVAGNAGSVVGNTKDATKESGEPNHAGGAGGASVWYRWTAPFSGPVTFDTLGFRNQSGNSFRYLTALMAVYTGSALNGLTSVVSSSSGNSVTFNAVAGTTYQIAVDSAPYSGGGYLPGILPLHWGAKAVANDDFVNAQTLTSVGSFSPLLGSNAGATKEAGEPNHQEQPGGSSVWYRWTALSNASASFVFNICSTCSLTPANALISVYTGTSVGALTVVPTTLDINHTFQSQRGVTYFIAVDSSNGTGGTFEFSLVSSELSGRNDSFSNPQVINGSTGAVAGDNSGATKEAGEPNHANDAGGASVWYRWTAPANGIYTVDTFGSSFDTLLGVYTGNAVNALTLVGSSDNAGVSAQSRFSFQAAVNTTYYFAVDGKSSGGDSAHSQTGFILLSWSNLPPPANDNFANAQVIEGSAGNVTGRNSVASKEGGEPNHAGNPGGVSVWYKWTAPATGSFTFNTSGSDFNTLLSVYTGDALNALTVVGSNDDMGRALQSSVSFNATAGTVYYLAIDGSVGVPGTVTSFTGNLLLNWFPASLSNDNFAQAQVLSGNSGSVANTNAGATRESVEPNHAGDRGGRSLWYSWTASFSGPVLFTTLGSNFDTVLAVYTGTSVNTLTPVAGNDDSPYADNLAGHPLSSSLTFTASAGTTYKIAVDGSGGRSGNFALRWGPEVSISGQVAFLAGFCGLSNDVTVILTGEDARAITFNGSGIYTFSHLRAGGNYSVSAASAISGNCLPLFLERAQNYFPLASTVTNGDFIDDGLRGGGGTSTIAGRVTNTQGLGVSSVGSNNITVTLSGAASRTVYASSNGSFTLNALSPGTYTVTPSCPSVIFNPGHRDYNFPTNQNILGADFNIEDTYTIEGQARNSDGSALVGVTVTINNGSQSSTTQTEPSGYYSLNAIAGGSYSLTAAKPGLTFPSSANFTNLSANLHNVDFIAAPLIQVAVQTNPAGRTFTVDGTAYIAAQTFSWTPGSSHSIDATSLQSGGSGTQYAWSSWSDGGAIAHTVAPNSNTTYTANFTTQYFLTLTAGAGGNVSPASGFFGSGESIQIRATPNTGFSFGGWTGSGTGSFTGSSNPATVTMNGPISETASFTQSPPPSPSDLVQFSGSNYTVGEGDGVASINVVRIGDASNAVSVDFVTGNNVYAPCDTISGSAARNCDYIVNAGTLNFASGETSKTFRVLIIDDAYTGLLSAV